MKEISIESFGQDIEGPLLAAQTERLSVTQQGKPLAVLVGVANKDQEDWQLENSPDFWRMIEQRRGDAMLPWKDVKESLLEANQQS
jgi:antitoxin (DNA-binding transcriptional repressor) of toxin-antitoxin stability system